MRAQRIFEPLLSIPGKTCPFYLAILNNWVLQAQRKFQETQEGRQVGFNLGNVECFSQGLYWAYVAILSFPPSSLPPQVTSGLTYIL